MSKTYYDILEINQQAPEKEIKSAFRKLARKHHPDVKGDPARFREIYEAYETLIDSDKRAKYDSFGHEKYNSDKKNWHQNEPSYPSYEEIFKENVRKMTSTETLVDEFVPGYPSMYVGGEGFEDPHTGDLLSSAEDIKIAKMDRALGKYRERMKKVKQNIYGEVGSLENLRALAATLFNMKSINEEELEQSLKNIDEYEISERKYEDEKLRSQKAERTGDPIQEKIEKRETKESRQKKELKSYRRLDHLFVGKKSDENKDKRSTWRKEINRGKPFGLR